MKLAFVRSYPIPNGSCSGNPVLCGASSLVLVGTIWMRYPLLCLSGAKLRLKMRPCNKATPDNHCNYRQHAAKDLKTIVFRKFRCYFAAKHWTNDLKIWWNKHLQQRISLSLLQRLFASMMLHWRTDLLIHCRTVVWKWWSIATVQGLHNGAMTDRHGHQSVHIFELAGNHRNE